jgi:hypothetical protein
MNSCWPSGPPAIGQTAELSRAVAPGDIERFTQISGDRNPPSATPLRSPPDTSLTVASLQGTAIWASSSYGAPWHMWRSDSATAS